VRRQPARASVLVVFGPADDPGFFFGFGLPASTAVDVANTSSSAASGPARRPKETPAALAGQRGATKETLPGSPVFLADGP